MIKSTLSPTQKKTNKNPKSSKKPQILDKMTKNFRLSNRRLISHLDLKLGEEVIIKLKEAPWFPQLLNRSP